MSSTIGIGCYHFTAFCVLDTSIVTTCHDASTKSRVCDERFFDPDVYLWHELCLSFSTTVQRYLGIPIPFNMGTYCHPAIAGATALSSLARADVFTWTETVSG